LRSGSRHLLLGAAALFEGKWRRLKTDIESLLARYFPNAADRPPEIHCSDVRRGRNQHSKLDRPQRARLLQDACAIVAGLGEKEVTLFTVVYDKKWWWHRNPGKSGDDLYQAAFENLISRFDYYLKRRHAEGQSSKGLIIADPRSTAFSAALRSAVLKYHAVGTQWAKLENLVESVLFLASHESPGLQVADLCSYAVWRFVEHSDDSLGKPLRHCFDREPVTSHLKPGHWHGVRYYGSDPAVRARLQTLWTAV
jgi:hypothetical protein